MTKTQWNVIKVANNTPNSTGNEDENITPIWLDLSIHRFKRWIKSNQIKSNQSCLCDDVIIFWSSDGVTLKSMTFYNCDNFGLNISAENVFLSPHYTWWPQSCIVLHCGHPIITFCLIFSFKCSPLSIIRLCKTFTIILKSSAIIVLIYIIWKGKRDRQTDYLEISCYQRKHSVLVF